MRREDLLLVVAGVVMGVAAAAAYATFHAFNQNAGRASAFGEAMVFPGLLVIATVIAMVWLGWKANIDG